MTDKDKIFRVTLKTLLGEGNPIWQDDQNFISSYSKIQDISLVSPYRCYFIYQFAKQCNSVEGDFAQVGIYKGGSAKLIDSVRDKGKNFFLFDTFEGLPEHNPDIDGYEKGKFGDTSLKEVETLFKDSKNAKVIKGKFPDSADLIKENKFSFVYIDVDLYESSYKALEFFYSRMSKGGVIVFDDYGWQYCRGIKKSIDDFIEKNNIKEIPIITTKYQAILIKS